MIFIGVAAVYINGTENNHGVIYSKLVKPGSQFGIVVPGLASEFEKGYPDAPKELWVGEMFSFHSKDWWRRLWEKTGIAKITACYDIDDPKGIWWPWATWAKENFDKEWGGGGDFVIGETKPQHIDRSMEKMPRK